MKTKKKNQPDNGAGSQQGAGWLYSSCHQCARHLPAFSIHSTRVVCQHPSPWCVHAAAIPCLVLPARRSPMPAFSALSQPFAIRSRLPTPAQGVHMYTCVQWLSLLSVVWRIPPPWDHVYIAFNRGRLWVGGVDVGVACRRGGLSNTALSTTRRSRRRRRFPVIKSHACMSRGLLVRRLRLVSFRLLGILQAFAR